MNLFYYFTKSLTTHLHLTYNSLAVLLRLEHDANAGPWERLGREVAGCEIRWIPLVEGTAELDLEVMDTLIDERTKVSG